VSNSKPEAQIPIPDLTRDLLRERFAMSSLLEFARTLTPDLGPEGIIKSVQRTIMGKGLIAEGFAYLSTDNQDEYHIVSRSGFKQIDLPNVIIFPTLEAWLSTPPERTNFTLPVFDSEQQEIIGFLGFGKSLSPETDIAFEKNYLESLSLLTGIALTNAALFKTEKERERYEAELRLAREIQQSLLPQVMPEVKGLSFTAYSKQSELVGGDYYDVIKLGETKALVAIADVVGKGISAAILMSSLQASLHALVGQLRTGHLGLKEMVIELNHLIFESTAAERYITGIFAIVDSHEGKISCIICGHPKPIVNISEGDYCEITKSGIPLGIIPDYDFQLSESELGIGSYFALYTDGLSEAISNGHMLGGKGAETFLGALEAKNLSTEVIEQSLFRQADLAVSDDITLVIVKREG
jgi:sigma-B regulation protein RsbU (phosphoserine phosphatase)